MVRRSFVRVVTALGRSRPAWRAATAWFALVSSLLLSGCGAGTAALIVGLSDSGGSSSTKVATNVVALTPSDGQAGRVLLSILLTADPGDDLAVRAIEYSLTGD